jgi:hypothetical protein
MGLIRGISTFREEGNHRFYRILAIRCLMDFVQNVKKRLVAIKWFKSNPIKGTFSRCS